MEQHLGFAFVPGGGELQLPPHYVRKVRTQTIVRCTQGISHTQMNTALCACGVSWKVSSTTGRGYNQTSGYGEVLSVDVGDHGTGFVAGPASCTPRDRHQHRGMMFSATVTVDPVGHVIALEPTADGSSGYKKGDTIRPPYSTGCGRVYSGHGWVRVVL